MKPKLVSALIVISLLLASLGVSGTLLAGPEPDGPVGVPITSLVGDSPGVSAPLLPAPAAQLDQGRPLAGRPDVLLVNADSDNDDGSPIQDLLQAYGDLGVVSLFDARYGTPTLAELRAYDVVLTWSNYSYADPVAMGNILADYVDAGGKVINLVFSLLDSQMQGRFMDQGYTALKGTSVSYSTACLGTYNPTHPIMDGVTSVCDYYRLVGSYLTANSHAVARWTDNELFVAAKNDRSVVSIAGYVGHYYQWTDQMPHVVHNAILWLAGGPHQRPNGGLLYMTSLDIGNSSFAVYNPASDAWTTLTPYETGCQMAVSGSGQLYAYGYNTGSIDLYDPATDSWTPVMAAPPGASGEYCNLEITNAGEFLYTQYNGTTLWYTAGGVWNTLGLSFGTNVMGDYDFTADQFVVGQWTTTNAHWIDVHTWAITDFSSAVPNGEFARSGVVLGNRYHFEAGGSNWHSFDLTDPALPPVDHGFSPGWFTSAAGDRSNAVIYIASIDGTALSRFDVAMHSIIPLAGYSTPIYHSSVAFVPQYLCYLPAVLRHYPWNPYYEPNNHWLEAYGPLISGKAYRAYPDDQEDYYYFTLPGARTVSVVVSDYAPTSDNGQLFVYGPAVGDERGPQVGWFSQPGHTEMRLDGLALGAGKYYVRVYTSGAWSTSELYTLRVTY